MRLLVQSAALVFCALDLTARAQEKGGPQKPQTIVKEGVEIEFTIEPAAASQLMAGQDAVFRFKFRDTATKTPLSGVKPAAWVAQRDRPGASGPDQCRAKVQSCMQGSLRSRPDVDLNAF